LPEGGWVGVLNYCIPVILCCFPNRSQVGICDSVVRLFVSSAVPKLSEGGVLDSAHFGPVWVPTGSGPFGDLSGKSADAEHSQDQVVQVVVIPFILDVDFS